MSKTCVWRWQERYMVDGVDGLVRDKTRPPRIAPLDQAVIDRVIALTNTAPPHEATHWTAGTAAVGVSIHDYKRHGTTTLFAALNVLDGRVIGRNMQRHRHQEFTRFLNAVERAVPAGKIVHAVVDNYAAHKHPKVRAWLDRHPRWTFHLVPLQKPAEHGKGHQ